MKAWVGALALVALAGCGPRSVAQNEQVEIANATTAYEDVRIDADARADRLDQQATTLDQAGRELGGAAGDNLLDRSREDRAEAAAVRDRGQAQAAGRQNAIEARDGLINQR